MTYKLFVFVLLMTSCSSSRTDKTISSPRRENPPPEPVVALPGGNNGIAARYPGDIGIDADTNVIFSDDFESYNSAAGLTARWNEAYHSGNLRIASEPGNFFKGSKALEFRVPQTTKEVSNTVLKNISPEQDSLFLRYYARFDTAFNVLGSSHNGTTISAKYCCPGERANGNNKFMVSYEAWRDKAGESNPGKLNIYVYHPEQRDVYGDHFFPTGRVTPFDQTPGNFGSHFVEREDVIPELGRWYCYELMVKANTPGQRNGRVAIWLDGNLIADFPNLQLRDTNALRIDRATIDLHVRYNSLGETKKWIDNVVIARSYIGPLTPG